MHFLKKRSYWIVNSYINLRIKTVWFILQSNLSAWAGRELSPVLLSDTAGNKHVHTQTLCPWGKTHHWTVTKNSKHLTSLHYWTYLSCACAQGRWGIEGVGPLRTNLEFQHLSFQNSAGPGEIMLSRAPEWHFGITSCGICTQSCPAPTKGNYQKEAVHHTLEAQTALLQTENYTHWNISHTK